MPKKGQSCTLRVCMIGQACKGGPRAKAELLRKLDEEIVKVVHEDELEGEIEHADELS